jgi:carbon storage regulator
MLVLTRKVSERIYVGDDIVITVVAVRDGHTVQLGIDAPKYIQIEREEVRQRTVEEYKEKRDGQSS